MQKRILKNEKGSITLFVLLAILFFLIVIFSVLINSSNKNRIQMSEFDKIKQEYDKDVNRIDEIYDETASRELIQIAFDTNGGTFNIAKDGTVDVSSNISITYKEGMTVVSREYGWSNSSEQEPSSWTSFSSDDLTVKNSNLGQGSYYLWVRVENDKNVINTTISNVFQVNENEIDLSKNPEGYTQDKITVTIDYKDTYVTNKKVGFGETLEEAMQNAVANEGTSIEVTKNGFVYVTAEDAYGNVSSNYIEIDNIDTKGPIITLTPNGGEYVVKEGETTQIDVNVSVKDNVSGVNEIKYCWTTSNTEKPSDEDYTTIGNNSTIPSEDLGEGTYYLWIKTTDNAGNETEEPSYAYVVRPPLAPTVSLKENDANGKEYASGTWTNQDVYHEISIPASEGKVEKYQYSTNGEIWRDYIEEDTTEKVNYTTTFPMTSENKPTWLGNLTNNGNYYFIEDGNGAIKANNGDKQNLKNTTANSYIKIDLTSFSNEDSIKVTLNAQISSEGPDYGYATITESTEAPQYSTSTGRFIYISGTSSSDTTATDYSTTLIGGKIYYLHLGYRKDVSVDSGNDNFVINSIKLENGSLKSYSTTFPINNDRPDWMENLENNGNYYFVEDGNGSIVSNNKGISGVANSYIKLDLSDFSNNELLNLTINASISSKSSDYGYATITNSTDAPSYSSSTGRIFRISGTSTNTADYSTTLKGGQVYYLHFGYRKSSSSSSGTDTFTINSLLFSSETMMKPVEFYDYTLNGNTLSYKLKDEMNKDFYVKAIYEDESESATSQFRVQIDKTAPIIGNISTELPTETSIKLTISDIQEKRSGLKGYYLSTENTAPTIDSNWVNVSENTFEVENLNTGTTYYIWFIDKANNISEMTTIDAIMPNYRIDNSKYAITLEQALNLANNNSTIELLNDYTDSSTATINKNIILNTGNYTLTRTTRITISGGTEEEPITFELTGKITTSSPINTLATNDFVIIKGAGVIENTYNSTSNSYRAIYNTGTLTQEGDLTVSGYYIGIYNSNTYTLNTGKAESTCTSSGYGIYNNSSGNVVNINGGEVSGYYGIDNSSGTVNINSGTITGIDRGIYASSSGTTNINGGYISGNYGIYESSSSANVNVLGGTVAGSTYGIRGYGNNITIGDKQTEVNQVSPVISGGQYGIYMSGISYTYNFYNGIIMGTNTKPYTDTVNPREGYMIYTFYDYENARKYCAVLTTAVDEIEIAHTPTEWTNQDVTVEIKYPVIEGTTLQYSKDGENWETIENGNGNRITVSENTVIYARMSDASGIVLQSTEHEITNIDKISPTITIDPETTKYIVDDNTPTVDLQVTASTVDEGGSDLDLKQYAWGDSKDTEPNEWNDFGTENSITITKNDCAEGTYYLWFKVTDSAGNKSDITAIRYIVEYKDFVAKIGENYYYTIQDAVDSASTTASVVEILKDTDEVTTIKEGQNITIELNGHTVGSSTSEQATFTNNGTLTIIDTNEEKTGTIENLIGTGIENNGTLTIGDNTNLIDDNTPTVSGKNTGITNNNTLNYYDGTIIGKSAINGNVQSTPESYGPVGTYREDGMTVVNLRVVSDYVARIEWFYYPTLQSAFDACTARENNVKQTAVHMLRDIILDNTVTAYYGQNILLNLNGHMLTNSNNTILDNYGNLEITDLTEDQNGSITSSVTGDSKNYYQMISNDNYLKITGGQIALEQNYNYAIYNDNGIFELSGGKIISTTSTTSTYMIYNNGIGSINIMNGTISGGSYGLYNRDIGSINIINGEINNSYSYGIYNYSNGTVNIINGKINSNSVIYNYGSGTINIKGGEINSDSRGISNSKGTVNIIGGSIHSSSNSDDKDIYGIYNSKGTINIEGGLINSSSSGNNYQCYAYGIYNSSGIVNISGGSVVSECSKYMDVCGIYNNTGSINISGGSINTTSRGDAYGIYNASNGIVSITKGTISANTNAWGASGIYNTATGIITIGTKNDAIVNQEEPNIVATYIGISTANDTYGIYNIGGSINLYDGIIQGMNSAIQGGITEIESGFQLKREIIGDYDSVYLENINDDYIVRNSKTGKEYISIQEAIEEIKDENTTLILLKNFELRDNFKVDNSKNIIIDLNGFSITNNFIKITNNGILTIKDSTGKGNIYCNEISPGLSNTNILNLDNIRMQISTEEGTEIIGINNSTNASLNIVNSTIQTTSNYSAYGIKNKGNLSISKSEINATTNNGNTSAGENYGIYNLGGIADLTDMTINTDGAYHSDSYALCNTGVVNFQAELNNSSSGIVYGVYNRF